MGESICLSLSELERHGRLWGRGLERRALCPFCGAHHASDSAHASLALNIESGLWTCHRCGAGGLLEEYRRARVEAFTGRPLAKRRRSIQSAAIGTASLRLRRVEHDEQRARLRRLWSASPAIASPPAHAGAAYLAGRGITLETCSTARVRYACDWYGRKAVVFPLQDASGKLVAAEGRYLDSAVPKTRGAGRKCAGVFLASPDALEDDRVVICEGPITALSVAVAGRAAIALCGKNAPAWLAGRLACREVVIAFDEGEQGTEVKAAKLVRDLTVFGARPHRLRPPTGSDLNDQLQILGLARFQAELTRVLCRVSNKRLAGSPSSTRHS